MSKTIKAAITAKPTDELPSLEGYIPFQQAKSKLATLCEERDTTRRQLAAIESQVDGPVDNPAAEARAAELLGDTKRCDAFRRLIALTTELQGLVIAITGQTKLVERERRGAEQLVRESLAASHRQAARAVVDGLSALIAALQQEQQIRDHLLREGVAFGAPLQTVANEKLGDVSLLRRWIDELTNYAS